MANETNHQDNLEYIQELLSPYLDGEVTDEERTLVEQAIETSPELRQELESLRQTVTMVKALPPMPAPRPFTLSQADVQSVAPAAPKKSFWLSGWAGGLALLATTVICVVIAGGIFLRTQVDQSSQAPADIARLDQAVPPAPEKEADEAAMAEPAPALEKAGEEQPVEEEAGAAETRQEAAGAAPATEVEAEKEAEPAQAANAVTEEEAVTITQAEGEVAGAVADDSAGNMDQTEALETQEEAVERDANLGTGGIGGGVAVTEAPSPLPMATATPLAQPTPAPEAQAAPPVAPAEEPAPAEAEAPVAESAMTTGPTDAATTEEPLAEAEAPAEANEGEDSSVTTEEAPVAQPAPASEAGGEESAEKALADTEAPPPESQDELGQAAQEETAVEETVVPPTSTPTLQPSPTPQPTLASLATATFIPQATSAIPPESGSLPRSPLSGFILGAVLVLLVAVLIIVGGVIWWVINKKS